MHSCTTAAQAADFHIARLTELRKTFPGKEVIVTEFGWPSAPEGGTEVNRKTKQHCGVASKANQSLVIRETLKRLAEKQWSGVVFEAFSENWKPGSEGLFGASWGICQGEPPYRCGLDLTGGIQPARNPGATGQAFQAFGNGGADAGKPSE